jgi:arginyl-tRNA synthetase
MKNHLRELLTRAIEKATKGGELRLADLPPLLLEPPKQKEFGDLATNVALIWAKAQRKSPRAIAEAILRNLDDPEGILAKSEIAGPGFINFTFSPRFCYALLEAVDAGRKLEIDLGGGARVQVEFASANPTGPLHVGHGRVAVIGDVLARMLAAAGFTVEREYYVNDSGRQIEQLGLSVYARYRELHGERVEFPADGYPGDYVREVAAAAKDRWGEKFLKENREEAVAFLSDFGGRTLLDGIRADLGQFGIAFDSFISEKALREQDEVGRTIDLLRARGLLYREEGAEWFRATAYGDDKDRTVVKSDGELTYFASDIAYHRRKIERGFNRLVNVWGADHHGYVSRLKAAIRALGHDPEILQVVLVQMVHLTRAGEPVRMGKRSGDFVTLREVVEEVGKDAARFFFLMRKSDSHLDFDLELAKKESSENPVFYVQYAHARISSIFEQARQCGIDADGCLAGRARLERLAEPEEMELIKRVVGFPEIIEESVKELEPHRLAFYLLELAGEFHRYYNRFRVISDDRELAAARLVLLRNVQKIICRGLELLGVEAPTRMAAREESVTGRART